MPMTKKARFEKIRSWLRNRESRLRPPEPVLFLTSALLSEPSSYTAADASAFPPADSLRTRSAEPVTIRS